MIRLNPRPHDAHKGTFGHLLVIAGSRRMAGAACLATIAGLRSGAGLVTLATPAGMQPAVAMRVIAAMTIPLPEDNDGLVAATAGSALTTAIGRATALAVGPGLDQSPGVRDFLLRLLARERGDKPVVLDADGLNNLADDLRKFPDGRGIVLTPHPREFSRISGFALDRILADPLGQARQFVKQHRGFTLVLKGHRTVVVHSDGREFTNTTGNVGLATGGTGDVLTGMLGSLMAQGLDAFDAAVAAVHAHGLAGDLCAAALGSRAMTAEDLLDYLAPAWRQLEPGV